MRRPTTRAGRIRAGIGGWNFAPWRGTFNPSGIVQSRELDYASRQVTTIEINGVFYRLQNPDVFAKWHDSTPREFMFSIKAPRFIVQRKELAAAGPAVERFVASGSDVQFCLRAPAPQYRRDRDRTWAKGREPTDLPKIEPKIGAAALPRDVFIYFINGAKERAPAAAQKLISILR